MNRISTTLQKQLFQPNKVAKLLSQEQPAVVLKQVLQEGQAKLDELFDQSREKRIQELVNARAWLIDQVIIQAWEIQQWPDKVAMIAVGGYGRGELHPHSDIDLLILFDNSVTLDDWHPSIESLVALLWDIGLGLASSVRNLNDCYEQARDDVTIATNLLEARTLRGDTELLHIIYKWVISDDAWGDEAFFKAKVAAQQLRHQRTNNTEYSLEPNIKNSAGGLRDLQIISWIGKRQFGTRFMRDLVKYKYLTKDELETLNQGMAYLWTLRYALHMISGRAEERLLFDHQRQLATYFGYQDNEQQLAVEQFMHKYYRSAMHLAELNQMLLQHFDQAILQKKQPVIVTPINRRFEIRNQMVSACYDYVFKRHPYALIEVYVVLAQESKCIGISASTKRLIHNHCSLIDDNLRCDIRANSLFMELLRSPSGVHSSLLQMKNQGVLGNYLPAFGKIIGQMQHDLFHLYTVDTHSLKVLEKMRQLRHVDEQEHFPIAGRLVRQLPKMELLYIAALFHDIAKGRGGNHSELGVADGIEFCRQHHLGTWDTQLVSWLIRHHLLLSMTAQRCDIDDPDVIYEFAHQMEDQLHLDYLYAFTICDINGTNPKLWNSWRSSLLRQLYNKTQRVLRKGLDTPIDHHALINQNQNDASELLEKAGIDLSAAKRLWNTLGDDYFVRETASNIAWHTEAILEHYQDTPLIAISKVSHHTFESGTQIFVYSKDYTNLFATLCAILGQLNLNIHDARIITADDGHSMDTFVVLDANGDSIDHIPALLKTLRQELAQALNNLEKFAYTIRRRIARTSQLFNVPTQVTINSKPGSDHSIMELITADRPGLLARVGMVFRQQGIKVHRAKIQSIGERAEDVFFITDAQNQLITDQEIINRIKKRICEELDSHQTIR